MIPATRAILSRYGGFARHAHKPPPFYPAGGGELTKKYGFCAALLLALLGARCALAEFTLSVPRAAYDVFAPILVPEPAKVDVGEERVRYWFPDDTFESARLAPLTLEVKHFVRNLQGTFVESANVFYLDVPILYEDAALDYALGAVTSSQIDAALDALNRSEVRYWEGRKSIYIERVAYLATAGAPVTKAQVALADKLYARCHAVQADDGVRLVLRDAGRSRMRWFAQCVLRQDGEQCAAARAALEDFAEESGLRVTAFYPLDVTNRKSAKDVTKALVFETLPEMPAWPDLHVPYNIDGFTLALFDAAPAVSALLLGREDGKIRACPVKAFPDRQEIALAQLGYIALCDKAAAE